MLKRAYPLRATGIVNRELTHLPTSHLPMFLPVWGIAFGYDSQSGPIKASLFASWCVLNRKQQETEGGEERL